MLNVDLGGQKGYKELTIPWKILDVNSNCSYPHDLNSGTPMPFDDNEVDNFYASMILEHICMEQIQFVFNEIHRCLKPGGTVRIVVPDIFIGMSMYFNNPKALNKDMYPSMPDYYPPLPLTRLLAWIISPDRKRHDGHQNAFDKEVLEYYLRKAGFDTGKKKLRFLSLNKCSPVFAGKDHTRYGDWSIYCEATK